MAAPSTILIVGSGVFGLSTAYALTQRPSYAKSEIIVLDRSPFPSPDGSSVDTSRIIRADYSDAAYGHLAAVAQEEWRKQDPNELGGSGRYTESGLLLTSDTGPRNEYVRLSMENVKAMMEAKGDKEAVELLPSREAIEKVAGTGGGSGNWGYSWADATAGLLHLRRRAEATKRIKFLHGDVASLLKVSNKVRGVTLTNGTTIEADLTILATGAWTGKLVDLRGRATATGQVLMYLNITPEEQARYARMPVLLNMGTGLFIIPPANNILKVARHGYGYTNPTLIPPFDGRGEQISVSLPRTCVDDPTQVVPEEGVRACREALREMIPALADRPFSHGRICWYNDTPTGDFLITYHPDFEGLFLATGGSGHGYKFMPAIGDKIADTVEGRCPKEFKEKWAWPKHATENVVTLDGSRGGRPGMILEEELRKGSKL